VVAGALGWPDGGGEVSCAGIGMTVKRERTRSTARKRQNCFRGSRVRRDYPTNFDALLEESLGYKDDVVGPQFHVWIVLWGPQNLIKVELHPHLFFAFRP